MSSDVNQSARRLDGKVAVVTGGARGIGRGICRKFASEGAKVVVADIADVEGEAVARDLEALGGKGLFVHTDVSRKDQVGAMIAAATDTWGRLDVLVNDAIGLSPHVTLEHKSDEMFDFSLRVGFYATLWSMQAAMPIMRTQGGGRIINFYSADADSGQWYHGDYNSTKAAIRALTVSAAAEWGRYNILCNAISPIAAGTVYHELLKDAPGIADVIAALPLGRMGDPETDIGPVALFLASADSQYVNGQTIVVDGGLTLSSGGVYPADSDEIVEAWNSKRPPAADQ
ncbi:MAG: short-chain dehydrogenase/reductase [Ilumatobacteraceae bacterium]|nr:short-chain dehydrogenase/reductase [Ilumatobacteraceae bacterium]